MRLDAALLRLWTRLAHALQRRTGVTSYRLAQHAFIVSALSAAVHVADYWCPWLLFKTSDMICVVVGSGAIVFALLWATLAARAADAAGRDVVPREMVFLTDVFSRRLRLLFFWLAVLGIPFVIAQAVLGAYALAEVLDGLSMIAIVAGAYLVHVPPLPPATARSRSWVPACSEGGA